MRVQDDPPLHLTYCLNIHPGETWADNLAAIRNHGLTVRTTVFPNAPFGLGLRLSRRAAAELSQPTALADFKAFLDANDLYVFTVNGFPYGPFHGTSVKSDVYKPDWRTVERLDYTNLLADLLAELLPEDVAGSISTVPGSYKSWITSPSDQDTILGNLRACGRHLTAIREHTGRDICLALEPEPNCLIENTDETIAFFAEVDDDTFRRHVGVCVDLCHLAVAFEDPSASIARLAGAGIRIAKVQLSAALRCTPTPDAVDALGAFCDPVYLHQVKARTGDGALVSYDDLPAALDAPRDTPMLRDEEWRIHFHVPLFLSQYGPLQSTGSLYTPELAHTLRSGLTQHLEIETYTFDVLPEAVRETGVTSSIAREFNWVLDFLRI